MADGAADGRAGRAVCYRASADARRSRRCISRRRDWPLEERPAEGRHRPGDFRAAGGPQRTLRLARALSRTRSAGAGGCGGVLRPRRRHRARHRRAARARRAQATTAAGDPRRLGRRQVVLPAGGFMAAACPRRCAMAAAARDPRRARGSNRRPGRTAGGAGRGAPALRTAGKPQRSARAAGEPRAVCRPAARLALGSGKAYCYRTPPFPLPVICLDQGEELFGTDAGAESETLLQIARAAIDADEALALVTIRSDAYGGMQNAKALAGVDQVPLSLGPVPQGEIARVIREPAEILRRKVGPDAPRVRCRRHRAAAEGDGRRGRRAAAAGLRAATADARARGRELSSAWSSCRSPAALPRLSSRRRSAAFTEPDTRADRADRREVLRRLFVPRLARINRDSKEPQRRMASKATCRPISCRSPAR